MKNILHPQKHTPPHAETKGSKLETATDDRHMGVTPEQRHQMIAEAAYRRAQKRSFVGGNPENDWYEAEAEIGQLFSQSSELHNEPQHWSHAMRATHRIVNKGPFVTTLAALALCALGGANAAVIYDNGVAAVSVASQSDFDPQRFAADNFVLQPGATTITDVHWRGVYGINGGADTPGTDAFTIQFYADAGGGVPVLSPFASYSVGSAVNRTDTLLDLGSGLFAVDIYSYSAVIAPLALTAGTTYWLSIFNDTRTDIDDNWAWGAALGGDGFANRLGTTSAWTPSGVQFSRTLDFQLTNDVPEPGTLALLGLGFAALASTRRRMRSV